MFSTLTEPFYIPTSNVHEFQILHILTNNIFFLNSYIIVTMKCDLIGVLIYIFFNILILFLFDLAAPGLSCGT